MMLARVSHLESFRRWRDWEPRFDGDVEPTLEELIASITTDAPTEAMKAGTAFHKVLEDIETGSYERASALGYTFELPREGTLNLSRIRELRGSKAYGDLTVTGQVDGIFGRLIVDHKTTSEADLERYLGGAQWKLYLDIFGADVFRWNIFEITEIGERAYRVSAPQILTQYRYPEMSAYCMALANDYLDFAREHLPAGFEPAGVAA